MKRLIVLCLTITLFALVVFPTNAAESTTSANTASTSGSVTDKARDLLERVATKVAELVQNERHAYSGTIKSKDKTTFVITTSEGDATVTTNDVTDFYRVRAGTQSELTFASLKAGDNVATIGVIDSQTRGMTARQVIVKIDRTTIVGTIESIFGDILTLKRQTGGSVKIDLTDALTLEKAGADNKIVNAKLADFASGQTVFAIGYSPDEKTGTYSVLKALTLTN